MVPVICPSCRATLAAPATIPLANMQCPRCKNPLQGLVAAGTPPGPFAGPPISDPAQTAHPPVPTSPFDLAPPATSGPKRFGIVTAWIVGGVLLLGLGLDVLLLSRGSGRAGTKRDEAEFVLDTGKGGGRVLTESEERRRFHAAIDRGVAYLKDRILVGDTIYYPNDEGGGSSLGPRALAGLTLLECSVLASDPAIERVAEEVRRGGPRLRYTYSICLAILFLDRLDRDSRGTAKGSSPGDKKLLEDLSLRLIAAQNTRGGWGYNCDLLSEDQQRALSEQLKMGAARVGTHPSKYDDNSINQFATLALWAARRHCIRVEKSLELVEKRYRDNQNPDGSWGYREGANDLKAATTCAGLIGLAVGRGMIEDKEALKRLPALEEDEAVKKGLSFLAGVVGKSPGKLPRAEVEKRRRHGAEMIALNRKWHLNPESRAETEDRIRALDNAEWLGGTFLDVDAWGDLYFLWSVERVGVIYSLPSFDRGKTDWYGWGVPLILGQQRADGSWHDRFPGVPDTCFALLFLRRANVAQDLTDRLQSGARAP